MSPLLSSTSLSPTVALQHALVRAERTLHAYVTQTPDVEWMLGSALHENTAAVTPALRHLLIDLHLYLTHRNLPADTLWADAAEEAAAEWTYVHDTPTVPSMTVERLHVRGHGETQ